MMSMLTVPIFTIVLRESLVENDNQIYFTSRSSYYDAHILGRGKNFSEEKFELPKKSIFSSQTFLLQNFVGSYGSKGAKRMTDHSF